MALSGLAGLIRFKISEQEAMPSWQKIAVRNALNSASAPPEALRFQCRIAVDAQENFALIKLESGETLTLHHRSRPQFGKNRNGQAYLTVTMVYSGDGESYALRWVGNGVPLKMQQVAVKHDKGLAVKSVVVALHLEDAQVTPSWKATGNLPPDLRDLPTEYARRKARAEAGSSERPHPRGNCARLTDADLERMRH